jgi:hydroxypyruvate isomerase
MPRFAANLSMMYTEHAFLDRFAAAAADGFDAIEYLFPYAFDRAVLAEHLRTNGLTQALFNAPPGDFESGERGLACLPDRVDEFRRGFVELALPYAAALGCHRVHVMAGLLPAGATPDALAACYLGNLAWAADQAARHGVAVLIEPINPRDIPGYFLNRQDQAHAWVQQIAAPNLQVQMDLYHCQIVEGDLAMKLRQYLPGTLPGVSSTARPESASRVGHIQIAGVPERHEPDLGELNYPYLLDLIDALGYTGFVGCEYRPRDNRPGGTSAGLGWLRAYRAARPKANA